MPPRRPRPGQLALGLTTVAPEEPGVPVILLWPDEEAVRQRIREIIDRSQVCKGAGREAVLYVKTSVVQAVRDKLTSKLFGGGFDVTFDGKTICVELNTRAD